MVWRFVWEGEDQFCVRKRDNYLLMSFLHVFIIHPNTPKIQITAQNAVCLVFNLQSWRIGQKKG